MEQQIVIIGGGIAGLTAAYYLQKEIHSLQLPLRVLLIESTAKLGGKIKTVHKDGFVIERGPDSFLERKTSASRLAKEVGLEGELVNNATGKSYVLVNGKLHSIPQGSMMGIPTQIKPFLFSGMFSPLGKLRAGFDFILPRSKAADDQSLGYFFRRRLGNQVVENLIEPLLSGIYAGDIDEMSLMATFPQFYQVEQKHRSIVLGMKTLAPPVRKTAKPKGIFQTLRSGLQTLSEAVEQHLEEGSVLKSTRVERIEKKNDGYVLQLSNGKAIEAVSVIVAAPHQSLANLLPQYEELQFLHTIPSTTVANVALAFSEEAITRDINGTGFIVSRNSDFRITACTWTHKKWPHTTPKGKALLRCYVGRPGDEEIVEKSDDEIVSIVMEDLKKTMDIDANPEFAVVSRWKQGMPQYTVGHKQRLAQLTAFMEKELPGIYVAGSSYRGAGVPDCIDQGEAAVKQVLQYISKEQKLL